MPEAASAELALEPPKIIDVQSIARCSVCGRECCNCTLCVKAKGRVAICGPCSRRGDIA